MAILVTGGTGFIGGALMDRLVASGTTDIVLLVRPETVPSRYARFQEAGIQITPVDLRDREAVQALFGAYRFEVVYHIAAIRGAQPVPWEDYYAANVLAVEHLAREAAWQQGRLVYCSSVGVFGTIPRDLPATEATARVGDNHYHHSKILAEEMLCDRIAQGLDAVILRPTITYGPNDYGFPYSLIRLVDRGLFVHTDHTLQIHIGDVQVLVDALIPASRADITPGSRYIVGDRAPVSMRELVDLISNQLKGQPYPGWKRLPAAAFDLACFLSGHVMRSEPWKVRFQLISQSWTYDVKPGQQDLGLDLADTLDRFGYVVEWYLNSKRDSWQSRS
jgi:nucleoside-diphosphate-sugar epimerase